MTLGASQSDHQILAAAYSVEVEPFSSLDSVRADWDALSNTGTPFFLGWAWIGTWLSTYTPQLRVVRVRQSEELIAVGIFALSTEQRHRLVRSTIALLQQTGKQEEDQIWIEYNGLLSKRGHEASALAAVIDHLQSQNLCQEVHLSMLPDTTAKHLLNTLPHCYEHYAVQGYQRNLRRLREEKQGVLEGLSSNTRHQIRRSNRLLIERYGDMSLVPADNVTGAVEMFHEAGEFHRERWVDSGFINPHFIAFHENLIKSEFDHDSVQLFRVCVGDTTLGVFYFLLSNNTAYFYLQGLRRESNAKLKPGLSCHVLLMDHFLDQGFDYYDFMGGDSQYKRQLADERITFMTLRAHNGALKYRLEDRARELKRHYLGSN